MRGNMRLPWAKKQARANQERRQRADRTVRQLMEEQFTSFSTGALPVTSNFVNSLQTFMIENPISILPPDRGRVVTKRESKQSTLEPVLTDPPPLRPTRQFE